MVKSHSVFAACGPYMVIHDATTYPLLNQGKEIESERQKIAELPRQQLDNSPIVRDVVCSVMPLVWSSPKYFIVIKRSIVHRNSYV